MELDLAATRAFVAVADLRHFGAAADRLGLSQQAVSKRIARLEDALGAGLLHRTSAGSELTADGAVLLPHARAVLAAADQAVGAVRARRRALRVDVLGSTLSTVDLLRGFHEAVIARGGAGAGEVEMVTSVGLRSAVPALLAGDIDAAYARVIERSAGGTSVGAERSAGTRDARLAHTVAFLEPVYLLVGRRHEFAGRDSVRAAELAGVPVWMPGNSPGAEWTAFYADLEAEFGARIETTGPHLGMDHLIDEIATDTARVSIIGERTPTRMPYRPDVDRIPVVDPVPVYPTSLLWRRDARHPLLPALISHTRARFRPPAGRLWMPLADRELLNGL